MSFQDHTCPGRGRREVALAGVPGPGELPLPPHPASGQDPGCHFCRGITAGPPDLLPQRCLLAETGHHFEGQTLEIQAK